MAADIGWLGSALDYVIDLGKKLSPVEFYDVDGRKYTNKQLQAVGVPTPTALQVSTLSGLADLLDGGFEGYSRKEWGKLVVHVVSHDLVQVVWKISNQWGTREQVIVAKPIQVSGFKFGEFYSQEQFIIALNSQFEYDDQVQGLSALVSRLTAEAVTTSEDDGISAVVTLRQGSSLVLKAEDKSTLRARIALRPYRTFREIEQPVTEFILRLQQANPGQVPKIALFEADGGKWKLDAIATIARTLAALLGDAKDVLIVS